MRVDADLMQNRRLKITNAHRILSDVIANVIRAAVRAWLNPAAGYPHRKSVRMMVPANETLLQLLVNIVLHHRSPTELAPPTSRIPRQPATTPDNQLEKTIRPALSKRSNNAKRTSSPTTKARTRKPHP